MFNDRTDIINRMIIQVSLAGKVKLFKDAYLGIGLTPSLMAVSYTHLDVYKRQSQPVSLGFEVV